MKEIQPFTSIQELREFVNTIPEDRFCRLVLKDGDQKCVIGHINNALHGDAYYRNNVDGGVTVNKVLGSFGISLFTLADANNSDVENPKRGALKYIDSVIESQKATAQV